MQIIQKLSIVYVVILVGFLIPILTVIFLDDIQVISEWENVSELYYERLILAGQAILGLIILLSVFYLGKFHDYKKSLTQSEIKLKEITWKFKQKYQNRIWDVNKDIFELSNNSEKTFDDLNKILDKFPKMLIAILTVLLLIIAFVLVGASANEVEGNQKNFIMHGLILLLAISEFLVIWSVYETMLNLQNRAYRIILYNISSLERYLD
ncbi:MAG: hypothetical protein ACW9W4_00705 [Candidatus Nitrosopumilus sp. bin_7KS]